MRRYSPEQSGAESDSLETPGTSSRRLEVDINLAVQSHTPVLITATPDDALRIAAAIAARGDRDRPLEVLVCDAAAGDDVVAAMADSRLRLGSDRQTHVLLIREVQLLKSSEQAAVYERLTDRHSGQSGAVSRIIASSSIDLYVCVERGAFDARLFYRLNAIHIVAHGWPGAMAVV